MDTEWARVVEMRDVMPLIISKTANKFPRFRWFLGHGFRKLENLQTQKADPILNHLHVKRTVVFAAGFGGFPRSGNLWKLKSPNADGLYEARIAFSRSNPTTTRHKLWQRVEVIIETTYTSKMRDT